MEDHCKDCQSFEKCQWLIQREENDTPCDWEPSRFIRKGRIQHHFACDVIRRAGTGAPCNCKASERAAKTLLPVRGSCPKKPSPPVWPKFNQAEQSAESVGQNELMG
jgi:hypothetical protein